METNYIIDALERHAGAFEAAFRNAPVAERTFRTAPGKWNLHEIICHLHDEEREDFRTRVKHILDGRQDPMPPIDPPGWVKERDYEGQPYDDVLDRFIAERRQSVAWLRGLQAPAWDHTYRHPKFGEWTADFLLANWLAHDYLHLRQISRVKYLYLKSLSGGLDYAGDW